MDSDDDKFAPIDAGFDSTPAADSAQRLNLPAELELGPSDKQRASQIYRANPMLAAAHQTLKALKRLEDTLRVQITLMERQAGVAPEDGQLLEVEARGAHQAISSIARGERQRIARDALVDEVRRRGWEEGVRDQDNSLVFDSPLVMMRRTKGGLLQMKITVATCGRGDAVMRVESEKACRELRHENNGRLFKTAATRLASACCDLLESRVRDARERMGLSRDF